MPRSTRRFKRDHYIKRDPYIQIGILDETLYSLYFEIWTNGSFGISSFISKLGGNLLDSTISLTWKNVQVQDVISIIHLDGYLCERTKQTFRKQSEA